MACGHAVFSPVRFSYGFTVTGIGLLCAGYGLGPCLRKGEGCNAGPLGLVLVNASSGRARIGLDQTEWVVPLARNPNTTGFFIADLLTTVYRSGAVN